MEKGRDTDKKDKILIFLENRVRKYGDRCIHLPYMLVERSVKMVVLKCTSLLGRRKGMEFHNIYLSHNDKENHS